MSNDFYKKVKNGSSKSGGNWTKKGDFFLKKRGQKTCFFYARE